MDGAKGMIPAVLAGVLIESGGAKTIAETLVRKFGETRALFALAFATMVLTAVGVFIDVAVITVAPIAIAIARADLSRMAILLAMIGGGRPATLCRRIRTPSRRDAFHIPLTSMMMAGIIPAVLGLFATYLIAKRLSKRERRLRARKA